MPTFLKIYRKIMTITLSVIASVSLILLLTPFNSQGQGVGPRDERPGFISIRYRDNSPQSLPIVPHKPYTTLRATITTYQAVPGQTDTSNCVGADPRINFCDPPFPIVAANGYPFGTKVIIRGVTYSVHDRMNKRYGRDHFDILTYEHNYKLTNEPVQVLK